MNSIVRMSVFFIRLDMTRKGSCPPRCLFNKNKNYKTEPAADVPSAAEKRRSADVGSLGDGISFGDGVRCVLPTLVL